MLAALESSLGIVTTAAKSAGIDRSTHYNWLRDDPAYKAAVDDIQEIALDFAETKLHKQIENNEVVSTIFYLKTKGKRRGYIEKTEHEHSGQIAITKPSWFDSETADKLLPGKGQ